MPVWLDDARQKLGVVAAILLCAGAAAFTLYSLGGDERSSMSSDVNEQLWIDSDRTSFQHRLTAGETEVIGPNGKPAYRAELCYWNAAGRTKPEPTAVLLNEHLGLSSPTFCPDCDRLVTPLNRVPQPGLPDTELKPPPTRSEHLAKAANRKPEEAQQ